MLIGRKLSQLESAMPVPDPEQPVSNVIMTSIGQQRMCYVPHMERISQERLRLLLTYDRESGHFHRKTRYGSKRAGTVAHGYRYIYVDGRRYAEHQLAWLYVFGLWVTELDHINRQKDDNRIANLRPATRSQNAANTPARGTLNVKGVSWCNKNRRFRATMRANGEYFHLGYFETIAEAKAAYQTAAVATFGDFASD